MKLLIIRCIQKVVTVGVRSAAVMEQSMSFLAIRLFTASQWMTSMTSHWKMGIFVTGGLSGYHKKFLLRRFGNTCTLRLRFLQSKKLPYALLLQHIWQLQFPIKLIPLQPHQIQAKVPGTASGILYISLHILPQAPAPAKQNPQHEPDVLRLLPRCRMPHIQLLLK